MPRKSSAPEPSRRSRRRFLAKLTLGTLGAAAVAGVAAPLLGLLRGGRPANAEASGEFPGPDSIFHPAIDPRLDPRRK